MQPTYASCRDGNLSYSIEIQTLSSDPAQCPDLEDQVVFETAVIKVRDKDGVVIKELNAYSGEFSYVLNERFFAPKLGLDLNKCVSPLHGGAVTFAN